MPHFSAVLDSERDQYRAKISETLNAHFVRNRKVHLDVQWRNIGKYINKSGIVSLVVFDLYDVVDYDEEVHDDWINKAMQSLFVS